MSQQRVSEYVPQDLAIVSEKRNKAIVGAYYSCSLQSGHEFLIRVMEITADHPRVFACATPIIYVYGLLSKFTPIPQVMKTSRIWIGPLRLTWLTWSNRQMKLLEKRSVYDDELLPVHAFGYDRPNGVYDSMDRIIPMPNCPIGTPDLYMSGAFADLLHERLPELL
jgi:hypothetical protein